MEVNDQDLGEDEEIDIDALTQMCYGVPTEDQMTVLVPLVHG